MESVIERFDTATKSRRKIEVSRVLLQDRGLWPGARLEVFESRQTYDLPESVLYQHGLAVHEAEHPPEVRWSGQRQSRSRACVSSLGILPAGMPYSTSGGSATSRTIGLLIRPDLLGHFARFDRVELIPGFGVDDDFLRMSCQALIEDARSGHTLGALYGESVVAAVCAHLVRCHSADPRPVNGRRTGDALLQARVRDFILDRLCDPLTLSELAAIAEMDVYAFCRWFKKAFGISPYRFVLRSRIERAKVLLSDSRDGIVAVALACGFSSQSHMTHVFQRFVGLSPSLYRKLSKGS